MDEKKDIVPELLEALKRDFNDAIVDNKIIADKSKKLLAGKVNFNDVYDVSHEVGNTLKNAFKNNIKKDILPNGKMYYNIANRAVKPKLKEAHDIISSYGADVQGLINQKEGINVKGVKAEFNEKKTDNLVNKLCEYDDFDDAKWLLYENINNYCNQSVDETIRANADFLSESGFKETISRSTNGGCCEWCEEVSGVFDYDYVKQWVLSSPDHNVFSRHRYCNCVISHNTKKGIKAVNNQWNEEKHERQKRKELSKEPKTLRKDDVKTKNFVSGSGKNYPIRLNGSEHVKFADENIEKVTVIAGKGTSTDINDINRLSNMYNMPKKSWQKVSGITHIYYNNKKIKVEVHWYEANGKRYEVKLNKEFENES